MTTVTIGDKLQCYRGKPLVPDVVYQLIADFEPPDRLRRRGRALYRAGDKFLVLVVDGPFGFPEVVLHPQFKRKAQPVWSTHRFYPEFIDQLRLPAEVVRRKAVTADQILKLLRGNGRISGADVEVARTALTGAPQPFTGNDEEPPFDHDEEPPDDEPETWEVQ